MGKGGPDKPAGFQKNQATAGGAEARKPGTRASKQVQDMRNAKPKSDKGQADISNWEGAIREAEDSKDPNASKYKLAVEMVNSQIGNEQTLGDKEYREAIDATYAQMDPTEDASALRGEDPIKNGIRGAREVIDGITDLGGKGIDILWDNTVGNLAGVLSGGATAITGGDFDEGFDAGRQSVSDWVNEDTGSIAADILLDLGLAAIPGVGIGLAAGKNAIQNSENIYEALTGVDDITGETIDMPQRLMKGAVGVGGTALSAVPGLGKAGNASRIAKSGREALENIGKSNGVVDDAIERITKEIGPDGMPQGTFSQVIDNLSNIKSVDDIDDLANAYLTGAERDAIMATERNAARAARADKPIAAIDDLREMAKAYPDSFRQNMSNAGKNLKQAGDQLLGGHPIKSARSAGGAISSARNAIVPPPTSLRVGSSLPRDVIESMSAKAPIADAAEEVAEEAAGGASKTIADMVKKFGKGGAKFAAGTMVPSIAVPAASSLAATYAEYGDDTLPVIADLLDRDGDDMSLAPLFAATFLPSVTGARQLSARMPSPSGNYGLMDIPLNSARAASMLGYYGDNPIGSDDGETDPEDAARWIKDGGKR